MPAERAWSSTAARAAARAPPVANTPVHTRRSRASWCPATMAAEAWAISSSDLSSIGELLLEREHLGRRDGQGWMGFMSRRSIARAPKPGPALASAGGSVSAGDGDERAAISCQLGEAAGREGVDRGRVTEAQQIRQRLGAGGGDSQAVAGEAGTDSQ